MKRITAASFALPALLAGCFSPVAPELPGDGPNTPPQATLAGAVNGDDVRVYTRAIQEFEVEALFNAR